MSRGIPHTLLAGAIAVAGALAGTSAFAADEPVNMVKYRQTIMKAFGGHIGALSAIAKGEVSFIDAAPGHAHAISEMSANVARLFPEGTGKGDTEQESAALQVIWEQPDEFQAAIDNFQEKAEAFAEVADGADQATLARELGVLGNQGCGGCHEDFREKED